MKVKTQNGSKKLDRGQLVCVLLLSMVFFTILNFFFSRLFMNS